MKTNKFQKLSIITLALLLIISAVVFSISSPQITFAEETTSNTVWDGIDITKQYYYREDFIDLKALMAVDIDKSKLSEAKPIKIAIIDTGLLVNEENQDLFDGLISLDPTNNLDWVAYNAITRKSGREAVMDETSSTIYPSALHGTSVASIMAMQIKALGLEKYIKLVPIKANLVGTGKFEIKDVIYALDYAANTLKVDVINLSLGTKENNNWQNNKQLQNTITKASETAIIVAAAGNEKQLYDPALITTESHPFSPACYENVISVMASKEDKNKRDTSNYGMYDVIVPGDKIFAYALYKTGTDINPIYKIGYSKVSGTSFAAPIVSAFSAIYKTKLKTLFAEDKMPRPNVIAETIINTNSDPVIIPETTLHIEKNGKIEDIYKGYQLKTIDFKGLLQKNNYDDGFIYQEPEGIVLEEVKNEKFNFITNYYEGEFQPGMKLTFRAKLLPLDLVHPSKEDQIEWLGLYANGETKLLGKGSEFTYIPTTGGTEKIIATYKGGEKPLTTNEINILVKFAPFVRSNCRVTTIDKTSMAHEDVEQTISAKQYKTITLGITGLDYVDRNVLKVRWLLNGKIVGTGFTYDYKPTKVGNDHIIVQIQDDSVGDGKGYISVPEVFTIEVQSFVKEPLAIFSLVIIGLICFVMVIITGYIVYKNKINSKMK